MKSCLLFLACVLPAATEMIGHFFADLPKFDGKVTLPAELDWLAGHQHYRLIPGSFPKGINYHFDGLAMVLQFSFAKGEAAFYGKEFESAAAKHWSECIFYASGSGPTVGVRPCVENPVVNILPLDGQLWLTIDTALWGRIDPVTLETIDTAKADVGTIVLNAHPACDRKTGECFVQHPCPKTTDFPQSDLACISKLFTNKTEKSKSSGNLGVTRLTQSAMPKSMVIQHSHSPCVTANYVVSKLDSFGYHKDPVHDDRGMLSTFHQVEDKLWLVMDRRTNSSRVMSSDFSFVNNHFWNCFENEDGSVVVDSVTATENYLSTYFRDNLEKGAISWGNIFFPPVRCTVPTAGANITCENLLKENVTRFDYPTFNPLYKMNAEYQWFYGISPRNTSTSAWFDRLIKVGVKDRLVASEWYSDGIYLTEADFIPRPGGTVEDDGVLVSVMYNKTANSSSLGIFDASSLEIIVNQPLGYLVPFHAHGISCPPDAPCYTNP